MELDPYERERKLKALIESRPRGPELLAALNSILGPAPKTGAIPATATGSPCAPGDSLKMTEESSLIDIGAEIGRLFDDSSIPADGHPVAVILMGGVAVGKTTTRKQKYPSGYVLVDAADIFLSLSRGKLLPFPDAFQEPMDIIGRLVARRALFDRRNLVTEVIGANFEATRQLTDALLSIGYEVEVVGIACDIEEAKRRNTSRGDDCISAHFAEPFQRAWIIDACNEFAKSRKA